MRYRTKQGDVLDIICKEVYGDESLVVSVLEANQGLADIGPVYQAGIMIELPEIATPTSDQTTVKLWD